MVQLVQEYNWFKGSIFQGLNWFKGSIGSSVQLIQTLPRFMVFNWFKFLFQLVQGWNYFKGSISTMVQLVKGFNQFRDQLLQGFN